MIMCFTHHQYCLVHFFSFLSPILFPFLSLSKLFVIRPSLKAQETKKIRLLMGSNVGHKSCRPLTLVWQHRVPFCGINHQCQHPSFSSEPLHPSHTLPHPGDAVLRETREAVFTSRVALTLAICRREKVGPQSTLAKQTRPPALVG